MTKSKFFLLLSVWGMELSWLYASAAFIMTAAFSRTFPLWHGIAASGLAIALTVFSRTFCRRAVQTIGIHLLGFTAISLRLIYDQTNSTVSFFNPQWLTGFLHSPKPFLQWLYLVLALLWIFFFWVDGVKLVKRPKNFFFVRNRFDLGVGIFLAILLIELLIIVKAGLHIQGVITGMLIFPFLIFSMMAFALIRSSAPVQRRFVMGYRGVGTVLIFAAIILLPGSAIVMLFLPHLTKAAEVSFHLIQTVAHPLGPVLAKVLIFIFGYRKMNLGGQETQASGQPQIPVLPEAEVNPLFSVLGWGLMVGFLLLAAGLLLFVIRKLLLWLFKQQPQQKATSNAWRFFIELVRSAWRGMVTTLGKLSVWITGPQTAVQLFTALSRWGHFSGLSHRICETPLEYGSRLSIRFPHLENDIQQVIQTYSETVYGADENNEEKLSTARSAFRRLRTPWNWPARINSLLKG